MAEERKFVETTELRALVGSYYDIQHARIQFENRVRAVKQRKTELTADIRNELDMLRAVEKNVEKKIKKEIENHSIYTEWLKGVRGIGPVLAGGLIGYMERYDPKTDTVQSIERFDMISNLWSYAGFGDPKVKRQKGVKGKWNAKLKTHCWKCGENLVWSGIRKGKALSEYAEYYQKKKLFYAGKNEPFEVHLQDAPGYLLWEDVGKFEKNKNVSNENHAELEKEAKKLNKTLILMKKTPGHIDAMARRAMVKLFLSHLWVKWRTLENLEVTEPYAIGILKHEGYIEPPEAIDEGNLEALSKMTIKALRAFAKRNDIDLHGKKTKKDIIDAVVLT